LEEDAAGVVLHGESTEAHPDERAHLFFFLLLFFFLEVEH
jgi:hypothetical protein